MSLISLGTVSNHCGDQVLLSLPQLPPGAHFERDARALSDDSSVGGRPMISPKSTVTPAEAGAYG
jgi:hypothetical protein